jgi:hypothetical protein
MANKVRGLASLALAALAIGACGDSSDGSNPEVTGTPEEQIAKTVNAMFAAWNAGDGELTCSYLTDRGSELLVRIAPQLHGLKQKIQVDNCEEAIEKSAAAIEGTIGERASAQQVQINPDRTASVSSRVRGALTLREVDGEWLVEVPTFID